MAPESHSARAVSFAPSEERRHAKRLYEYWLRLCNGRPFPFEEELDPDEIGDVWEDCFLIQVRDIEHVLHHNYTYLGANIAAAYHSGRLPPRVPGIVFVEALHLEEEFREVLERREPRFFEDEYRLNDHQVVKFRQCLLPLGDHQDRVASILGEMRFRIYEDGIRD